MRNWHWFSVWISFNNTQPVVPYLWGIDTICLKRLAIDSVKCVVPYLWGIDTLQLLPLIHRLAIYMLYLTYEELTRYIRYFWYIWYVRYVRCCTLPMRNWHLAILFAIKWNSWQCCTLPMRNWHELVCIKICRESYIKAEIVVPYLWGIDTIKRFLCFISSVFLLYLTYEELTRKAHHPAHSCVWLRFVVSYLWRIDTKPNLQLKLQLP